jgi:hypothetical protein
MPHCQRLARRRRGIDRQIEAGLASFDEDDPEIKEDKMKHERMGLPHKRKATGRADLFAECPKERLRSLASAPDRADGADQERRSA